MSKKAWYTGLTLPDVAPFCTSRQLEAMAQVLKPGVTVAEAASLLGVSERSTYEMLGRVKAKFDRSHLHNHRDPATLPSGYGVKGTSTLMHVQLDDGTDAIQWVKTEVDRAEQLRAAEAALAGFCDELVPVEPIRPPAPQYGRSAELLNCFVVTDFHLGMQAWGEETRGEDWDVAIAERLLWSWFAEALRRAPVAHTAILAQLGDFLHWDGLDAVTPTSGHVVDADTRFQKVVRTAIRVLRRVIANMLETHQEVRIIMAEGNHDMASSIWLREMFWAFYEFEPRVVIDVSPDPYYASQWGQTGLYFHHGHKKAITNIDKVFAGKFREQYGACRHNYAHTGHKHHRAKYMDEAGLMVVEQHPTLAAMDAFASRGGWLSQRGASVVTYHREYGEVGRVVLAPEAVMDYDAE